MERSRFRMLGKSCQAFRKAPKKPSSGWGAQGLGINPKLQTYSLRTRTRDLILLMIKILHDSMYQKSLGTMVV